MPDVDLATILADGDYLQRQGGALVGNVPAIASTNTFFLGTSLPIVASGISNDGVDRWSGITAFTPLAPAAGQVIVLWSFDYSVSASAGRVCPIIRHPLGGTIVVAGNQSYAASAFGSMTIVGSYPVAAGATCAAAFYLQSFGGGTISIGGTAIGYLIGT